MNHRKTAPAGIAYSDFSDEASFDSTCGCSSTPCVRTRTTVARHFQQIEALVSNRSENEARTVSRSRWHHTHLSLASQPCNTTFIVQTLYIRSRGVIGARPSSNHDQKSSSVRDTRNAQESRIDLRFAISIGDIDELPCEAV